MFGAMTDQWIPNPNYNETDQTSAMGIFQLQDDWLDVGLASQWGSLSVLGSGPNADPFLNLSAGGVGPRTFWQKNWSCVSNVGSPVLSSDLDPTSFGSGAGAAADATDQLSQAGVYAVAGYSAQRGLTVPMRSSAVRGMVTDSEMLGEASFLLSAVALEGGLIDAIVAEHKGCTF